MQKAFQTRTMLLAATALGMSLATPAWAQDSHSGASDDSGVIIVTARRTEERLQDVPISITVLNQQELTNRNIVNAQDLAAYTPSLSVNSNFGAENSTFAIRGFVQDIGTAPSVGVFFADVVAPRGGSVGFPSGDGAGAGSFFDLQNVQVLKGPQGTLQGRNTTGGAVMLVPQKPTSKLEGYVEGSIGNYDMRRIQGVINIPLSDMFRARIGIDRQKRYGYLNNIAVDAAGQRYSPSNFDDVNYTAIRASLVADLTPNLENYTIFSYSHSHTNGSIQKLIAAGDFTDPNNLLAGLAYAQIVRTHGASFYDVTSPLPNASTLNEQWQIINTTTFKASDTLTIKNILSYAQLKEDYNTALFGSNFFTPSVFNFIVPGTGNVPVYFSVITAAPGIHTAHESTLTEELQFQGRGMDDRLNWQAGLYFESAKPIGYSGNQTNVLGYCTNIATLQCSDPFGQVYTALQAFGPGVVAHIGTSHYNAARQSSRDIGIYAQASYSLTDQLKLTAGLRYTWDREEASAILQDFNYSAPNTPLPFICTFPQESNSACFLNPAPQKSHAPTWMIDVEYKPISAIMAYAKYSRGYRTGNVKVDAPPAFVYTQPEKVDTFEVGMKSSFHGAVHGTFNITGFYNNFSNQQIQLGLSAVPGSGAGPSSAPINVGKSRIYGLESEVSIKLFQGLSISAGYTYLNTRIKQINLPDQASIYPYYFGTGPHVGDGLTFSPRNKFTVTGTYTLPLDEKIGKFSIGATFTHTDSQRSNYSGRGYVAYVDTPAGPTRTTQDLTIMQATDLLNLNVNWNSVAGSPVDLSFFATNVTKQKYLVSSNGLLGNGFEAAAVGAPRMYGMRAKVRF